MLTILAATSRRGLPTGRQLSRKLSTKPGFYELRSDHILPGRLQTYLDEIERTADARKRVLPGFLGMWKVETGGSVSMVHHLYHWSSYSDRDLARARAADDPLLYGTVSHTETLANMTLPLPTLREQLSDSKSIILNEATETLGSAGLPGALAYTPSMAAARPRNSPSTVAFEMRTYQLRLGYSTVPQFLQLYGAGLKDKLEADDSGASELCTLLYSDCGSLNIVIEIWRHSSLEGSMASRQASRKASKWRNAVNDIAELAHTFETAMLRPVPSSPWR